MLRCLLAGLIAVVSLQSSAHELLTVESVQAYLSRVTELQQTVASAKGAEVRARASLQLGQTLDEIRELFNRDIDAHGRVQGLASNVLMSELAARAAPLAYSARSNRFTANLAYYRDALRLAPSGPVAAEAAFELLKGNFYESLGDDPLEPATLRLEQLAEQVRLGEALRSDFPGHAHREEASFILAIRYLQAARVATEAAMRARYLKQANELIAEFVKAYPGSLRVATLLALLQRTAPTR